MRPFVSTPYVYHNTRTCLLPLPISSFIPPLEIPCYAMSVTLADSTLIDSSRTLSCLLCVCIYIYTCFDIKAISFYFSLRFWSDMCSVVPTSHNFAGCYEIIPKWRILHLPYCYINV